MNLALQLCPPLVGVPQLLLQAEVGILLRTRCSRPHLGVVIIRQLVMMAMAMAMVPTLMMAMAMAMVIGDW